MPRRDCAMRCWIAAGILGAFVWVMTAGVGTLSWFEGLALGLMAAGLSGVLLVWLVCGGREAAWEGDGVARPTETFSPAEVRPARSVAAPLAGESAPVVAPATAGRPDEPPHARPRGDVPESAVVPVASPEPTTALVPSPDAVPVAADADDLKIIKGIGPKIEAILHAHGVSRFDQIAAWSEADVDRFAQAVGALGHRIRSEDWRGQAAALAGARS